MNQSKSLVRRLLELFFDSYRINDTTIYQLYLRLRFPDHYLLLHNERQFYHDLINYSGRGLVFDIGANVGDKTAIFKSVAKRIICIEPSPAAVCILRKRFARSKSVSIISKGVGALPGLRPFYIFNETNAFNTFSDKWAVSLQTSKTRQAKKIKSKIDVSVTTLDQLIDQFGVPSYIKIDVEGFEMEVLKGLSQSVNLISIECNLPEFEKETIICIDLLTDLLPKAKFNYCTTEPPTMFASKRWLSREEIVDVVTKRCNTFMEIYATDNRSQC